MNGQRVNHRSINKNLGMNSDQLQQSIKGLNNEAELMDYVAHCQCNARRHGHD